MIAENEKKPESTPKPGKGIPTSKIENIPPTPKPSKGIRVTAAKTERAGKRASFPKKSNNVE